MTDWERRVEEAQDKYVFAYSNNYDHDHHPTFHYSEGFTAGANWARERSESEIADLTMTMEKLDIANDNLLAQRKALRQQCEVMADLLRKLNVQAIVNSQEGQKEVTEKINNALSAYQKFKEGG